MENIDPALLEMINQIVTGGGEQWEFLAAEKARQAWTFVWLGLGLLLFCIPLGIAGYKTRHAGHEGAAFYVPGAIMFVASLVTVFTNLYDALAPMNAVLHSIMR